jgi:uncharacterized membrane protein
MAREVLGVPRWAVITSFLLSVLGLAISTYMTVAHFEGAQILTCPTNRVLNCAVVTTSPQSYFLGIPVAILGLGNYVVMTALNSPWGWRATSYWLHVTRLVLAIGSMCFVLWLISAELLIIDHICLWCTAVHVVTFALLIVLLSVSPTQLGWSRSTSQ